MLCASCGDKITGFATAFVRVVYMRRILKGALCESCASKISGHLPGAKVVTK